MKTKNIFLYVFIIFTCFSCESFLEENPDCSMVHGREIKGSGDISDALLGASSPLDPSLYLKSHLTGESDLLYSWTQPSAIFRTDLWNAWSIPVVHDHFWDFYFHSIYILYSKQIGYLNEVVCERERSTLKYSEQVKNDFFLWAIERDYQALKFLNNFNFLLIRKGYAVNYIRFRISARLMLKSIKLRKKEQIGFSMYLGLVNLLRSVVEYCLFLVRRLLFFI